MTRTVLIRIAALLVAAVIGAAIDTEVGHHNASPLPLTSTDIGFAQDMSVHHQQAVTIADMLAPDAEPDVRALAEQIRLTQLNEIGQMTGWLQIAGAAPSSAKFLGWQNSHAGHARTSHNAAMAGMASPEDLARLQRSTGRANETLFLQLMTRHHQGGIDMAAAIAGRTTTDAVHRAAVGMIDEQTQEIQVMAIKLKELSAAPLPYEGTQ